MRVTEGLPEEIAEDNARRIPTSRKRTFDRTMALGYEDDGIVSEDGQRGERKKGEPEQRAARSAITDGKARTPITPCKGAQHSIRTSRDSTIIRGFAHKLAGFDTVLALVA